MGKRVEATMGSGMIRYWSEMCEFFHIGIRSMPC